MNMVYSAMDVANYIIQQSLANEKPISNLKLQKILYYLQARYLVDYGKPLFNDDIQKWKYGPVVKSVYHEYKNYGSSAIRNVSSILNVETDDAGKIKDIRFEPFDDSCLLPSDKDIIFETVKNLNKFGAFELVGFTHEHSIWKDHEREILLNISEPYTTKEIEDFFKNNKQEQIWLH
ncbi:hypothetical protein ACA30_16960 [Virgibacillus soli]|uniref:Antitoxin SocA-like Panacea domain-containing protein n=2 Tax=Lederbergia galactosidilytica TaxID=217031 RepID=A0A0Q9Y8S4_9BACI|nr:hypothetical protein ACA29_10635 [Lederbergia galactosidilytica]KRG12995.1 hypothetical protein ACA30_16960 [Virgibacillus soli]OAK70110.1 hypothetical protein ABB05_13115 [Lederbergia galactosidilytica]